MFVIVIAPAITFILYLLYENSHYILGIIFVIAGLFSAFSIYSSFDSGVFKINRFDGAGQVEIGRKEKPVRFGSMILTHSISLIFYALVFYSIYFEDILNIPAP